MALFQNKPQVSDAMPLYTFGANNNILLVGLGNPGTDYELTRHNIGFYCLDRFVDKRGELSDWLQKTDLNCWLSSGQIGETRVIAIKPTTYMNLSGESVQAVSHFYKIPTNAICVIHDELDIDFGQIRLRVGGSPAGHKGITSVSKYMGEDYGRIRIGVGPKQPSQIKSEDFILQKFTSEEQTQLPNLAQEVNAILSEYIYGGALPHDTRNFLI